MSYEIRFSCVSHIGRVRSVNQDNLICNGQYMEVENANDGFSLSGTVKSDTPTLFAIFDGMGGEECGEVASYLAVKEAAVMQFSGDSVLDLSEYCKRANEKICEYADNNSVSSMGTTAAMLLCNDKGVTLCNVGDSKVFKLSQGELNQISEDHVIVVSYSVKPPLSQNLGIPTDQLVIEPYLSQSGYKSGDKYLICSDGLTDMVSVDEIAQQLSSKNPLEEITKTLLEKALAKGGRDNTTIILMEIGSMSAFGRIKNKFSHFFGKKA